MWLFNQASTAARTALIYITAGALVVIWTVVWCIYLLNNRPETNNVYYWCAGFLITGLTFILIGFGLGRIGRSARRADEPPEGVKIAVTNPASNGVASAPVMAHVNSTVPLFAPASPVVVPNGLVADPVPGAGVASVRTIR